MNIAIIGAGWLGFPLAKHLSSPSGAEGGHSVTATTTSSEKLPLFEQAGLKPLLVNLEEPALPAELLNHEVFIICVPPFSRRKPSEYHIAQIRLLTSQLPVSAKLIYCSSSSVYPDNVLDATEDTIITAETTGHAAIFAAEQMILAHNPENLVLRLAGLTGYDRFLARHFAGKKGIADGNKPVNLVHRDDVVEAIQLLLEPPTPKGEPRLRTFGGQSSPSGVRGGIYNICCPQHPLKRNFYTELCVKHQLDLPEFLEDTTEGKVVSSTKLIAVLGNFFKYPNPFDFQYTT